MPGQMVVHRPKPVIIGFAEIAVLDEVPAARRDEGDIVNGQAFSDIAGMRTLSVLFVD